MIQKINHKNSTIAQEIYTIFQISYAVEAALLNAVDFPPLKRTTSDFLKSRTDFYGYFQKNILTAVLEIKSDTENTHIQSLVVDPFYFRQGIGQKLVAFTFEHYNTSSFSVETGLENQPASLLYQKMGFIKIKVWDTNNGIRKVRFEKSA